SRCSWISAMTWGLRKSSGRISMLAALPCDRTSASRWQIEDWVRCDVRISSISDTIASGVWPGSSPCIATRNTGNEPESTSSQPTLDETDKSEKTQTKHADPHQGHEQLVQQTAGLARMQWIGGVVSPLNGRKASGVDT